MLILCTTTLRIAGIVSKDPKVSPSQHVEERGIGEDAREGSRSSASGAVPLPSECEDEPRRGTDKGGDTPRGGEAIPRQGFITGGEIK